MFIFYPKILSKYISSNRQEVGELSRKIDNTYVIAINIVCFTSLLVYSLLTFFVREFSESMQVYKILILSQIFINSSTVSSISLISQKKEIYLVYIGFLSILISVITSISLCVIGGKIELISLTVLFSSLLYSSLIFFLEKRIEKENVDFKMFYFYIFKGADIPVLFILFSIYIEENIVIILFSLILYLYICRNKLSYLIKVTLNIFSNNNMLKF